MEWKRNKFYNWQPKKEIISNYFINNSEPIEYWGKEKIKEYQMKALQETVIHSLHNNKYYKKKIQDAEILCNEDFSIEKFNNIECISKDELIKEPYLLLSTPKEEIAQIFLSTGTTSKEHIYVSHTWDDLFLNDLSVEMPFLFPISEQDIVGVALPYEMSSSGLSYHRVLQDGMGAAVVSLGKGGAYSTPEKTLKAMKELEINVVITSPSYIMYLFEVSLSLNINFMRDLNVSTIWLTGEGCSDAFRKRIEKLCGCKAYFYYGSLECGPIGIECSEQDGYHITSGHVYVEILDTVSNKILAPGEIGEIVITTLLKDGTPFIRYRTQDTGYFEVDECSCGTKLAKLYLRGRESEQLKIDNSLYSPYYIEENLMKINEVGNNYRFLVYDNLLLVEIEINKDMKEASEIEELISSKLEYSCGVPNIIKIVDSIGYDGTKVKRVIKMGKPYKEEVL